MKANTAQIHTKHLFRRTFKGILSFGLMATIIAVGSETYAESDSFFRKILKAIGVKAPSQNGQMGDLRQKDENELRRQDPKHGNTPKHGMGEIRQLDRVNTTNSVALPTPIAPTNASVVLPMAPTRMRVTGFIPSEKPSVRGGTQNAMATNASATPVTSSGHVVDLTK